VNWLDILLLASALSFGWSGYRQGFVVGVLAFTGFIGGGVGALLLVPSFVSGLEPGLGQSLLAVAAVLLAATVGQVLLAWLGSLVRDRLTWRPARVIDASMGALVSVLAMLLVAWFLASALRPVPSRRCPGRSWTRASSPPSTTSCRTRRTPCSPRSAGSSTTTACPRCSGG
jgi:hypothetical protein